jgi:hypothetical protein
MQINKNFLIIWTNTNPRGGRTGRAADANERQLLAAGPIRDVSAWDFRPGPAGAI